MYRPFKHDRVTALKQCQVLWLLCRSLAPRRYNKQKSWECALQWCSQDPQHLPALPATHLPLAYCPPVCWGFLVILFYLPPDFFYSPEQHSVSGTIQPPPCTASHSKEAETDFSKGLYHVDPLHHSKSLGRSNSGTGKHSQVPSTYRLWWKHCSLEFGNVDCSFPGEELGYLWL